MYSTRTYAMGTSLTTSNPWGLIISARVLCPDGKVRQVKRISQTADTFFSIPAAVTYKGKTVAGYVTIETLEGFSVECPADPPVCKFVAVDNRRNSGLFPNGGKAYRKPLSGPAPAPAVATV